MPFVFVRTSVQIGRDEELRLKERIGQAIGCVPGKCEENLLLGIEGGCCLYLAGRDDEPVAYVEVNVFGNERHLGYDRLTAEVTNALNETLGIMFDHVYLRFVGIEAWGVAGMYVDRGRM